MTIISKSVIHKSAQAIAAFISEMTPITKKGVHSLLLLGSSDVTVELKAGLDNKVVVIAKVGNCIVHKDKFVQEEVTYDLSTTEALYNNLQLNIAEQLYDTALIADSSLGKLFSAVNNRQVNDSIVNLPGGFTVVCLATGISIRDHENNDIVLKEFQHSGYALSPAVCIPKTIAVHMVSNEFKPFNV